MMNLSSDEKLAICQEYLQANGRMLNDCKLVFASIKYNSMKKPKWTIDEVTKKEGFLRSWGIVNNESTKNKAVEELRIAKCDDKSFEEMKLELAIRLG